MKLKDKKIELLIATYTTDDVGNRIKSYVSLGSLWAYYRQLTAKETHEITTQESEECVFYINYHSDITTDNFIRWRGDVYDIVRIDIYEGYKTDLKLYCRMRRLPKEAAQKVPDTLKRKNAQSVTPYTKLNAKMTA